MLHQQLLRKHTGHPARQLPCHRPSPPAATLPLSAQEAFQLAQAHAAPAEGEEFPGLDWQGWEEIAAALGIEETVDAPVFRWVLPASFAGRTGGPSCCTMPPA